MKDVTHQVIEEYGVLSVSPNQWERKFCLVSWNGARAKYDLRDWAPDGLKMSRGLTLTHEEIARLHQMLGEILKVNPVG